MRISATVDEGLGNSSYLVEVGEGVALAVDPSRDPRPYRAQAARAGWRIAWTADTHLHADFVTGSRELALDGAQTIVPADAEVAFDHRGLRHGDEMRVGDTAMRALGTPGHTPEHLSYLLLDDGRPVAVFTGGSLLVASVARTDLITPDQTEPLARSLFRSINQNLLTLPDDVAVYPTHGPGSFCSAPAGGERVTTIGAERRTNPLLAAPDEDAFVAALLGSLGTYPPYFLRLREVNQRGPRAYGDQWPTLEPLTAERVAALRDGGALIVDVRSKRRYAAGHIPGSLAIALRPEFASWLGWLVEQDTPLVFVADAEQDRAELVRQCLTIGYETIAGELDGGIDAWAASGRSAAATDLRAPDDLEPGIVLDVRQADENASGSIPGAFHVELGSLQEEAASLPPGPLTVHCAHGERATTAASVLERAGRRDVAVLRGGPEEWSEATGIPLERKA